MKHPGSRERLARKARKTARGRFAMQIGNCQSGWYKVGRNKHKRLFNKVARELRQRVADAEKRGDDAAVSVS